MKPLWDKRYSDPEYVYGKEPNGFFAAQLEHSDLGTLLLPGEGEGRNAVYAALKGWKVDAFDQSPSGYEKAIGLASEKKVRINYQVSLLEDFTFKPDYYDLAGLIFFHVEGPMREYLHQKIFESLKPGGSLILEAFHKEQANRDTGGPKSLEMLFDKETLLSDFAAFETRFLEKKEILLDEGPFHQGEASVIRYIGKKPH
ncbi:MAG: class I SAM-dependent methyltransferase [Bacteroidales bacterium]|nr:class I SAM-dependent methyltransferase [Bacteroidales bacterium]